MEERSGSSSSESPESKSSCNTDLLLGWRNVLWSLPPFMRKVIALFLKSTWLKLIRVSEIRAPWYNPRTKLILIHKGFPGRQAQTFFSCSAVSSSFSLNVPPRNRYKAIGFASTWPCRTDSFITDLKNLNNLCAVVRCLPSRSLSQIRCAELYDTCFGWVISKSFKMTLNVRHALI